MKALTTQDVGVSVVVPVDDGGARLVRCLRSLERQDLDLAAFEVVAVDDGSTDRSGEVLDRYAAEHPNARVIHQPRSGGPGGPRNAGTDVARGEFVLYLDADDRLAPEALRLLLGTSSTGTTTAGVARSPRWTGRGR